MSILSKAEHDRIAAAIAEAESQTSGEIYCVLAQRSDDYFYPSAFFVALSILIVSLPLTVLAHYWWIDLRPAVLLGGQLAALATSLALLLAAPRLRLLLVPLHLRYRRAHENAMRQFLARNIHVTQKRTGVLIFVSLAEHYAEVLADAGIDARVPQERWNDAVETLTEAAKKGELTDGIVATIGLVGAELATHFPAGNTNPNELDNHVIDI